MTSEDDLSISKIVIAGMIGPALILGVQFFWFLRSGEWTPLSVIGFGQMIDFVRDRPPTSWIGLWKIFNWMPIHVPASIIGLMIRLGR